MAAIFPSTTGKNLNKKVTTVPDDFPDKNLIAIVAFQRWHQPIVDQCIDALEENNIDATHHIIEIPVIQKFSKFRQMRLDGVMRAGIRDKAIRARTITVYLDKLAFRKSTDIPNEESIHWFLIDHASKEILLRGIGVVSPSEVEQIVSLSQEK
ncbi:MAG: hypothetical protein GWP25_07370 [Euryarchaeota archaeon]|nr:hypothetical protein [Euryarchaeota archaeon]